MKKVVLFALLSSTVIAASPSVPIDSAQPLLGALESISEFQGDFTSNYIPGYGVQLMGNFSSYSYEAEDITPGVEAVTNIVSGLAGTIQGLEEGDWVSVSARFVQSPASYVTIRVKPDQPESLEVWVDGVKR
jgi:hypothetical protein